MLVKTFGSAVYGVEALSITVEVNWMATNTGIVLVGLPDNAVKESLQRVESTIKANGYMMPRTRVVVNLAPADIKKAELLLIFPSLSAFSLLQNNWKINRLLKSMSSWVN